MKRKHAMFVLIFVMATVLSSCATTVRVSHLVPAAVDLSSHRSLAIASTQAYKFPLGRPVSPWIQGLSETSFSLSSGYETKLTDAVAKDLTLKLNRELQGTGYFNVLDPSLTDAYLKVGSAGEDVKTMLKAKGVEAILYSYVSYMALDEDLIGRDVKTWVTEDNTNNNINDPVTYEKVTARDYFLVQKATMTFTYSVVDISTNQNLYTWNVTDSQEKQTKIGTRVYATSSQAAYDDRSYSSGIAPSFFPLFEKIGTRIMDTVGPQLAPTWEQSTISLKTNKPKNELAKQAYTFAERDQLDAAYTLFLKIWNSSSHIPSGYNAALMLEAQGDLQGAVDLMNAVYNKSGDASVYRALMRMQKALAEHQLAERQISGDMVQDGTGVMMTQFVKME